MARPRTLPDLTVHETICRMLAADGDKGVTFGTVARATGLAAATLVGRYGSRAGMIEAALVQFWDGLEEATTAATAEPKAAGFLKAISYVAEPRLIALSLADGRLVPRAEAWRQAVEAALALRLGRAETAAMMFATWQGQRLWQPAGGRGFRLKDAAKRMA
ncbi:hypothetical protein SAMN05878503_11380 [Cereibacter ovatus]|uniref:Uncharacterized protein n=1 Tax=Cereibacter ovatus TaxID=439529 RepID=A0A285CZB4_9RHOB|nr:transcriptional regulator [Cereibacter ovatus]SNX72890.1 hypothetical protein SAMN05878503_11380 [Cereibacter ovatus]